jgi:LruC domain-containing protein
MKKLITNFKVQSLALLTLLLFSTNIYAASVPTCSIKKQNGSSCYWTTLTSVTTNISGSYTIVMLVEVDGSSGGNGGAGCQALSHYSVEADAGTYSNVNWSRVTGSVSFTGIDMGPNIGNSQTFSSGFKLDGPSNFGDNHAGSFTLTYTISSLQDQRFAAKAGNYSNDASFTIADFQSVLNCSHQTGPTAVNDTKSTPLNTPVDITVLSNDIAGSTPIDVTSVTFVAGTEPPASTGTFSVNHTTGLVTFTPAHNYAGIATISYQIKDANNLSSIATITVTILPAGPTAVNDATTTPLNTPVNINVLSNDVAGSTPIDITSVTFVAGTEPPASTGTFSVNHTNGLVTFTPFTGFTGTATINYRISDGNELTSIATITVIVSTGSINYFPATGFGTIAFEDLWPAKGDYDLNDLVLDYKFQINSNSNNYIEKVTGTFVIKAFGASLENGFGFQLPGIANASDLTVTGYSLTDGFINLNNNGTESGQAKPTIIVYDNAFKQMTSPGGIGVNTDPNQPYVTPKTLTITINVKPNTYTLNDLDIANFNPFLIVNKVRGVEVHLPNYAPTSLVNPSLFGTGDDNSSVSQNRYYKTANNLPWAINTYGQFDYPKEKVDISQAYLHFAAWATSGGTLYPDWYKDLSGYRNASLIYQIPQ